MAINTYLLTIEYKKQNKQAEQNHKYREHFGSCLMGGVSGGWVKMVKGLRSTNW